VAVVAAHAALADRAYRDKYVQEVTTAKAWTVAALRQRNLRVHGDGGNYVLVWPEQPLESVVERLDRAGVLVRSMAGKPLIDGSFRLTIGTRAQMSDFVAHFDAVLASV